VPKEYRHCGLDLQVLARRAIIFPHRFFKLVPSVLKEYRHCGLDPQVLIKNIIIIYNNLHLKKILYIFNYKIL